jgi:hypothetical protein
MDMPSEPGLTETVLPAHQLKPLISPYLDSGWREEHFSIKEARLAANWMRLTLSVDKYVPDYQGKFHFSALQAVLWLQQMAIIYLCHDLGKPKEVVGEVIVRDLQIKFLRPIAEVSEVVMESRLRNWEERKGKRYYVVEFDVQQGAFIGDYSAVIRLPDTSEKQ